MVKKKKKYKKNNSIMPHRWHKELIGTQLYIRCMYCPINYYHPFVNYIPCIGPK